MTAKMVAINKDQKVKIERRKLKILVVKNGRKPEGKLKILSDWEYLPIYFEKLGHKVQIIYLNNIYLYPIKCILFKPDIIISIGKTVPYLTGLHRAIKKILFAKKPVIVFDITDHPLLYGSESRIKLFCKTHDNVTTPSFYNFNNYPADDFIIHGNDFKPLKAKIKYDVCYVGQLNPIYGMDKVKKGCDEEKISLNIVSDVPTNEVPEEIAKCKICVYPISWDSSLKLFNYAAMGKPVVAIKPNLCENIGFPAYYCEDVVKGIKRLLKDEKLQAKLGKQSRKWFLEKAGSWNRPASKYIDAFYRYIEMAK